MKVMAGIYMCTYECTLIHAPPSLSHTHMHTHALPKKHTPKDLKVKEELVEKWKGREMDETG